MKIGRIFPRDGFYMRRLASVQNRTNTNPDIFSSLVTSGDHVLYLLWKWKWQFSSTFEGTPLVTNRGKKMCGPVFPVLDHGQSAHIKIIPRERLRF